MHSSDVLYGQERGPFGQLLLALYCAFSQLRQTQYGSAVALTFAAVCLDSVLVSDLNTVAPAFSCGLLLLLMLRHLPAAAVSTQSTRLQTGLPLATWRLFCFFALHLSLVGAGLALGSIWRVPHTTFLATLLAASKYLIVLPTAILLPGSAWRCCGRLYRAEWVAAVIALVSFYPLRIFTMAWPWYGQALGRSVSALCHLFVPNVGYVAALTPTLLGPNLDVTIVFGCGGLQGIKLFQILFALVLVVDWNQMNRRRAVAAYFGGLAAMLIANAIRITLLFVLGNTQLRNQVIEYHLTAGWMLFTLAFIVYLFAIYRWLLKTPGSHCISNP
jgi:exosortase/archaeosortase family protein